MEIDILVNSSHPLNNCKKRLYIFGIFLNSVDFRFANFRSSVKISYCSNNVNEILSYWDFGRVDTHNNYISTYI